MITLPPYKRCRTDPVIIKLEEVKLTLRDFKSMELSLSNEDIQELSRASNPFKLGVITEAIIDAFLKRICSSAGMEPLLSGLSSKIASGSIVSSSSRAKVRSCLPTKGTVHFLCPTAYGGAMYLVSIKMDAKTAFYSGKSFL